MSNKEIGKHIRSLRKKQGITITQLAEKSGVSHSYISQIENGKFNPSPEILRKLSEPLGVSYEDLMIKAGYLIAADPLLAGGDYFIVIPPPSPLDDVFEFENSLIEFLRNKRISFIDLETHLYGLETDEDLVKKLACCTNTENIEALLKLLRKAVIENRNLKNLVRATEKAAVKHFSDLKNALKNNYKPTSLDELPIITFNGHPLTKQDRKRILGMLELMFPEYSGQNDDDDDNHDDNDDM